MLGPVRYLYLMIFDRLFDCLVTLTLNNQVIRLLSDLGNDDAFVALQNRGFTQWEVPEEQQPSAIDIAVQKNISYSLS
jgi:hypothetical protein